MPMRPFKLPGDLDILIDIIPRSFKYPENEAWSLQADEVESIVDQVRGIRRIWPIFRVLQLVNPSLRDLLRGYVWEEDGLPVGLVNVVRKGNTNQWEIGNVSVLPEYRRRGIARKLVEAAVGYTRDRGATQVTLDVIDGNLPAYTLYQKLGFETYSGRAELSYEPNGTVDDLPLPDDLLIEPRDLFEWRSRYELAQRITPEQVRRYEPVDPARFKQPAFFKWIAPLLYKAMGSRPLPYAVKRAADGQIVGSIGVSLRLREGGVNGLQMTLDPECGSVAPVLIRKLLREIEQQSPGRRVETSAKHWQGSVISALEAAGFERTCDMHTMGINFAHR